MVESHLTQEQARMALNLWMSTSASCRPVFKVSLYAGFSTFLTRLTSQHVAFLNTIVCGVVATVVCAGWVIFVCEDDWFLDVDFTCWACLLRAFPACVNVSLLPGVQGIFCFIVGKPFSFLCVSSGGSA